MDLSGKTPVKPGDIESELSKIWHETAKLDASGQKESSPRMRAILSNVVILVDDDVNMKAVDGLITELCIMHPSRFFLIEVRNNEETKGLATYLSSRCVLANSGKHVCSEEIYISSSQDTTGHVPNLLLSLFRPDVPNIFVLLSDFSKDQGGGPQLRSLVAGVTAICERIIFDSDLISDFTVGVKLLRDNEDVDDGSSRAKTAGRTLLRDLNWRRLDRWRILVTEQFESERFAAGAEEMLEISLHGSWPSETVVPGSFLLLAGWLISSLGWVPKDCLREEGKVVVQCASSSRNDLRLVLNYRPGAARERSGWLDALEFRFTLPGDLTPQLLRLERDFKAHQTKIELQRGGVVRHVPYIERKLHELMLSELLSSQQYRIYDEAADVGMLLQRVVIQGSAR